MIGTENGEEDDLTRRLATTVATSAGVCGRHLPLASRLERRVGIVGTCRRTSIIGAKCARCLTGGDGRNFVDNRRRGPKSKWGTRLSTVGDRCQGVGDQKFVPRGKRSIEMQRAGNPQVAQQKVLEIRL